MQTTEIIEGFAVETPEGLIFTVKGLVHPPDRVTAYLRYLPDPEGDRQRGDWRYRRLYHFEEQEKVLRDRYPAYLIHDPSFGIQLQGVPCRYIRQVYDPCRRLKGMQNLGATDRVEEKVLALASLLREKACIPMGNLGVSGSVLVGLHQPESDIDMIVYGEEEGRAVCRALRLLAEGPSTPVRLLNRDELAAVHAQHHLDTPLSFADFARLQIRKVNEGRFQGWPYFIRFVKRPAQVWERYDNPRFVQIGRATIRARVKDDRDAIFTPCRYLVEEVTFLKGTPRADLREVVSFRGRFSEQARAGEWSVARGNLERVIPRAAPAFCRLTVGGESGDYLLVR